MLRNDRQVHRKVAQTGPVERTLRRYDRQVHRKVPQTVTTERPLRMYDREVHRKVTQTESLFGGQVRQSLFERKGPVWDPSINSRRKAPDDEEKLQDGTLRRLLEVKLGRPYLSGRVPCGILQLSRDARSLTREKASGRDPPKAHLE